MGNSNSAITGSASLASCLNGVCGGRADCVSYPPGLFYQETWVEPYNLAIETTPAAVVRPLTTEDVAAFVRCASQNNVKVQPRSGGHSYANFALGNGQLVIDLVNFQQFSMDNTTWQATIGGGMNLGDMDPKLHQAGGRAIAHGVCPGVGIGGHATIGGLGPMSRLWGACLDHILELEVVTADGSIVRANNTQHGDLYWALKGAAAGFGIITEFVMRTHPEPGKVVQYTYDASFGTAAEMAPVFQAWQDLIADPALDRRFGSEFVVYPLGAIITGTFYGTRAEWQASGIPGRLPQPDNGSVIVNDWLGSLAHDAEKEALYLSNTPTYFYSKSLAFREQDVLAPQAIADLFAFLDSQDKGTLLWFVIFDSSGGAVSDVPMNATAYAHRDKIMFYQSYAVDPFGLSQTTKDFLTQFHEKLLQVVPPDTYGTYPGYVDPDLQNAQEKYWMTNLPRLDVIKQMWDPTDLFHNPQSVRSGSS